MRTRELLTILSLSTLALVGCSRRNWDGVPIVSANPPGQPTAVGVDPGPSPTPPVEPMPTQPTIETLSPAATIVPAAPLDPLWEELDAALGELDSALAGIEGWEVIVP